MNEKSLYRRQGGFTLVELLVVIGIIAVLVGILLPTLGRAREQAKTVSCAAQMRGVLQGIHLYAADNRGTLPWGLAWSLTDENGAPAESSLVWSAGSQRFYRSYRWQIQVNDKMIKGPNQGNGEWPVRLVPPNTLAAQMPPLSGAFLCPSVAENPAFTDTYSSRNTYGFNMVAMPNRGWETKASDNTTAGVAAGQNPGWAPPGTGRTTIGPAKLGQLYQDNALIWDGPAIAAAPGFYIPGNIPGGYPWSAIDSAMLMDPQGAIVRYRINSKRFLAPEYQGDKPISIPTRKEELSYGFGFDWANADSPTGNIVIPYFPNFARFRHQKDTICNVGFADGSVRGLRIDRKKVAYIDSAGGEVCSSEFIRDYLRIKQPGGLPPLAFNNSNSYP